MKGHVSIIIPTKRYLKAYMLHEVGENAVLNLGHLYGSKLIHLLQKDMPMKMKSSVNARLTTTIKFFINKRNFIRYGAFLDEKAVKEFNALVEFDLKYKFRFLMDYYVEIEKSFEAHLPTVREKLGIDIEAWSDDSMKKDYYRYRLANKKPLFYKSNFAANVPSCQSKLKMSFSK